jgi:hypothetical protein
VSLKERIALFFARREVTKRLAGWLEGSLGRPLARKEKKMLNALIGNWRTTLMGLIGAVVQTYMTGGSLKAALASVPMLLLGMMAKDSHVGSQAQP